MKENAKKLTRQELEEAGIKSCTYTGIAPAYYEVTRLWPKRGKNSKLELKKLNVSFTDDRHPVGYNRSSPIISFSAAPKSYCISWPRFIVAWYRGYILPTEKVTVVDDKWIWPDSFRITDMSDHSYYKKYNLATVVKEIKAGIRELKDYE